MSIIERILDKQLNQISPNLILMVCNPLIARFGVTLNQELLSNLLELVGDATLRDLKEDLSNPDQLACLIGQVPNLLQGVNNGSVDLIETKECPCCGHVFS